MKQTIEIEVPEGKKAVLRDNKIVFEDIKPQLPKTWKEYCQIHHFENEVFIDTWSNIVKYKDFEYEDLGIVEKRNSFTDKQAAEQHIALMQLHQLRDYYRQGWKPNCADYTTIYFIIRFYSIDDKIQKYCVTNNKHNNHFLSFQSKEIAEEFLNNFRDLIEEAGDLI